MDFPTRFDPREAEGRLYGMWESEGCFRADSESSRKPFTIVIPPPNVTGSLHMGHALNNTLQDILIRQKRMQDREALWLPGTDHAGIATQVVVERQLSKEGKNRWGLGREEFLKRVWEWKEQYGNTILYQLRRLGCSCDWSRTRFTMDECYSRAIRQVFVSLFEKGLIYRGLAVVNWCPKDRTALSDLEVTHREDSGKLWHIRYAVKGESGRSIVVATTRPETMLGDTAVAVHPDDRRYTTLVGKTVTLPLLSREIPVVADAFVDPQFGTGAVKVTPAHDANDFECSKRNNLPRVVVIDETGKMTAEAGPYAGLDRFECRRRVVADIEAQGLLEKVEDYAVPVGACARCSTVIEPRLSEQWFVRMQDLAAPAIEALKSGRVQFHPDRWGKLAIEWLEGIRDWCVSRQIWWGHRVPVWYCERNHAAAALEAPAKCPTCGGNSLRQDEDVLDTWFSSALWPFATLGWPDDTADLRKFYPTQVLVTDRGIINLWVGRMIMSGLEFRREVPFPDVVINATIMDDAGQRQSKSKGTGIDPVQFIDQYGADPVRFALAWLCTGTQDIKFGNTLSIQRVEMSRNFVTKLWNAARYVSQKAGATPTGHSPEALLDEDRWILSRLSSTAQGVTDALDRFEFGEAAQLLYKFVWNDFCDWYIELSKRRVHEPHVQHTLARVLDATLRILHPFTPFVTEEIWQRLGTLNSEVRAPLAISGWPEADPQARAPELERKMELVFEVVRAVREIRNRNNLSPKIPLDAVVSAREAATAELLRCGIDIVRAQANVAALAAGTDLAKPRCSATVVTEDFSVYIPLEGKIDAKAETERCRREIEKTREQVRQADARLADTEFVTRKPEMAEDLRQKRADLAAKREGLETHLKELETIS